ncbi:hypothetical protein H7I53_13070 [Mycolicibacterium pulveris]|uniref:PE-PGRS family protein n=1 Tax=Mycolicibacterium pulveris TaxID=36813 RepID=A0A7I7UPD2_MYCPV|nr:hypothetical protein [Mycolicibacterium pulveris]MCV6981153.1 hypothetical protein [Mycolicibacterium pulveris]BBY82409.1 hypothetical protein MPUL_35670 [Mycolicibacterium pulveris]
MQVAVRSTVTTGVALISAGVIAVSPVAPPATDIPESAATVYSAPVTLTATYAELLDNTLANLGFLYNDIFEEGIAPILQQIAVNQLTMVQNLGSAIHGLFEASNPIGIPATFDRALEQLAAGQFQEAAEILSTGVILAALPLLPPLQTPINNLVAVINVIPQAIPLLGIGLISPPLGLFQATAEAVQDAVNAFAAGDFNGVVNAFINAPATILDGVINGYTANGFPGLIGPNGGAIGVIVSIRDRILDAITPPTAAAATETETEATPETAETAAITATATSAARTVSLDVTPASTSTAASEDAVAVETATESGAGGDEDGASTATDASEEDVTEEEATADEATESAVDEEAETDDSAATEETELASGGTDLTDGNKVTPGNTTGAGSGTQSGDSSADSDAADDTDPSSSGADSSGDSSDSGSDSRGGSDSE